MNVYKIVFHNDRAHVVFYVTHVSGNQAAELATENIQRHRLNTWIGKRDVTEITQLDGLTSSHDVPGICDVVKRLG